MQVLTVCVKVSQCIRHLLCPRLFPDATEETTITTTDPIDPKKTITEKLLTNLEAKVKSRDHLLRELQKRDKNVAQPLRRALSLEYVPPELVHAPNTCII